MRILMIAPEPFFQPRGTPFSEYYRAKAFLELGHEVDLLTYPIGEDVELEGLRVFRAPGLPRVRSVPIGPSWVKFPLDGLLFASAVRRLFSRRYDVLDCHEEAGLMGVVLSRLFRVPTIYDMHSSLPEQLENFRFTRSRVLRGLMALAERWMIRGSHAVIAICPHLKEQVEALDPRRPCFLIENSPLAESGRAVSASEVAEIRRSLGLGTAPVILYAGTFEPYQGLDLLLEAMRRVVRERPDARLLMVGGHREQVSDARIESRRLGLEAEVQFTGQRPPEEMPAYLAAADILVSPRASGNNTPLKIYSYLRAGKPIVATRLRTHTQVLDDAVAVLTDPHPQAFANGILALASDPERARRLGRAAQRLAQERYSYEQYLARTRQVCDFLFVRNGAPAH
jgi:glycosyltransferase involved in cell wall biosynthesis